MQFFLSFSPRIFQKICVETRPEKKKITFRLQVYFISQSLARGSTWKSPVIPINTSFQVFLSISLKSHRLLRVVSLVRVPGVVFEETMCFYVCETVCSPLSVFWGSWVHIVSCRVRWSSDSRDSCVWQTSEISSMRFGPAFWFWGGPMCHIRSWKRWPDLRTCRGLLGWWLQTQCMFLSSILVL